MRKWAPLLLILATCATAVLTVRQAFTLWSKVMMIQSQAARPPPSAAEKALLPDDLVEVAKKQLLSAQSFGADLQQQASKSARASSRPQQLPIHQQ